MTTRIDELKTLISRAEETGRTDEETDRIEKIGTVGIEIIDVLEKHDIRTAHEICELLSNLLGKVLSIHGRANMEEVPDIFNKIQATILLLIFQGN
jgi:hypothetical protein